jgi:hypothetical protein
MLDLGSRLVRTCDGISRRTCLRVGTASLFGLSLPKVLEAEAHQPWAVEPGYV